MNRIYSKNIKIGDMDIHYLVGGKGAPLVVIHGGSDGAKAWKKTMAALIKNYTLFIPDMPGWGNSQPMNRNGDYFISELAEFVDGFSRKLGLSDFYLMGHSLGGAVALTYALKFPHRVKKLVLIDSLCLGKEIAWWIRVLSTSRLSHSFGVAMHRLMKGIKWFVDSVLAPAFAPALTLKFANPISAVSLSLGTKVTNSREQNTVLVDRLPEIKVPTLVVWGEKDPVIPASHAYAAARVMPNCQIKVFEDCGHSVYRQRIPEFSQLVGGFLG